MRWVVASDELGFELKGWVRQALSDLGWDVEDLGPLVSTAVDYPDYAAAIGRALQSGMADRGVMVSGSGLGACLAATKMPGVRAGLGVDPDSVRRGVEHADVNVLVLEPQLVPPRLATELIRVFGTARAAEASRHRRCRAKLRSLEGAAP